MIDRVLIFTHITRTGGSTLEDIIRRQHPSSIDLPLTIPVQGVEVTIPALVAEGLQEDKPVELLCITGHAPFGIHRYLSQPFTYVTLFRDPVDRLLSIYYQSLQDFNPTELHEKFMSLEDFVVHVEDEKRVNYPILNGHTRYISGRMDGDVTSETLGVAKDNLDNFFGAIGLCERFDESLILFKHVFNWKERLFYYKQHVTGGRPSKQDIPVETVKLIEGYNRFDMELYNYAEEMFEKLIQQQGSGFKEEVQVFKEQLEKEIYNERVKSCRRYGENVHLL